MPHARAFEGPTSLRSGLRPQKEKVVKFYGGSFSLNEDPKHIKEQLEIEELERATERFRENKKKLDLENKRKENYQKISNTLQKNTLKFDKELLEELFDKKYRIYLERCGF